LARSVALCFCLLADAGDRDRLASSSFPRATTESTTSEQLHMLHASFRILFLIGFGPLGNTTETIIRPGPPPEKGYDIWADHFHTLGFWCLNGPRTPPARLAKCLFFHFYIKKIKFQKYMPNREIFKNGCADGDQQSDTGRERGF